MKYCNYCGCPIDEPARFCPKCGTKLPPEIANAQFPTEKARSQTQTRPQRYTAYGVPISEPAQEPAVAQIRTNSETKNGMGRVHALLWICLVSTIILFAIVLNTPTGLNGTWKLTLDLDEAEGILGEDISSLTELGFDKMTLNLTLNEDHTMELNASLIEGKVSAKFGLTGTYETHGDNLRLNLEEETFYIYAYGQSTEDSMEVSGAFDFIYSQKGNRLTLVEEGVDDMEYQFKRS